jgi:hypothetical protein
MAAVVSHLFGGHVLVEHVRPLGDEVAVAVRTRAVQPADLHHAYARGSEERGSGGERLWYEGCVARYLDVHRRAQIGAQTGAREGQIEA